MKSKGFIKTIVLFIILVILLWICWFIYKNNTNEVEKTGNEIKSAVQEKKDEFVNSTIQEGKDSLGNFLKKIGEGLMKKEENLENSNQSGSQENSQSETQK